MSNAKAILLVSTLISAIAIGFLWLTEIPLGIPGEWVWERIRHGASDLGDVILCGWLAAVVGGLYVAYVVKGNERIAKASNLGGSAWLLGLTAIGFVWLFAVQLIPPVPMGLERAALVLYYPMSSGYFHEARYREESLSDYLADYEEDIQSDDVSRRVLHHGTHPPGLFMAYRGLIWCCKRSPNFTSFVIATQPARVEVVFDDVEVRARLSGRSFRDSDRAVIWLAALLTQLAGVSVVVPLFVLARLIASKKAAWISAAFWPLVPAMAVFLPKSDVLHAFFGACFLALWCWGFRKRSLPLCLTAGGIFWLGMMFSLAVLPVAFLALLWTGWEWAFPQTQQETNPLREKLVMIAAGAIGFLLPAIAFSWRAQMNLANVWWQNYQNHAEFYQHYSRSYLAWLLANPIEAFFALGAPLVALFTAAYWLCWKKRDRLSISDWGPYLAFAVMMGLLWVTGKNRGEAGRLWIVIFPYFVWLSAGFWDRRSQPEPVKPARERILIGGLLALQMLVCCLTAARVHGFPL